MPFIDTGVDFDEVKEPQAQPGGRYTLSIVKAEQDEVGGKPIIQVQLKVNNPVNTPAKQVFHKLWLPMAGDEKEKAEAKVWFIKKFFKLFNIPWAGSKFNLDDFPGRTGAGNLTLNEYPEGSNEFNNQLKL